MGTGGSRSGSGRPAYRSAERSYRSLDIRKIVKAGCIKPSNRFGWAWWNDDGEKVASVSCKVNEQADGLTVDYSWENSCGTEWQPVKKHIWLTFTPCNYGGVRWWFSCPCCQRRSAVLFIMGGALRCAMCGRVSYASQRGDGIQRTWIKQSKLEARLISSWQKPKRMRWKTYERLRAGIAECELRRNYAALGALARIKAML